MHSDKFRDVFVLFVVAVMTGALAQNDGQYRPSTTTNRPFVYSPFVTSTRRTYYDGRNRGSNDGRYVPSEGRYRPGGADGRYVPGNDGKYIHQDVPYQPGGGEYSGENDQYKGDRGSYLQRSTTPRPLPSTTPRPTASFKPYTYSTTTPVAAGPTVKGTGSAEGRGGWKIIRQEKDDAEDGYRYLFETENGILGEESGRVENVGTDGEGLKSSGYYEYTGDDGNLYRVEYTADENGFNPKGDHILPIPDSVRRTLEWLRAHGELDR